MFGISPLQLLLAAMAIGFLVLPFVVAAIALVTWGSKKQPRDESNASKRSIDRPSV